MTTAISERITRTRFVRRAVARAITLGLVVACLEGVAVAEPKTVHFPDSKYPTLKDAILDAGERGTVIIRKDKYPHSLPPGPDEYESYKLLDGQTLRGESVDKDGNPLSKLEFTGYTYNTNQEGLALGLWAGDNTTIKDLGLSASDDVVNEFGPGKRFVASIVVFGDKPDQPVKNATITNNYITSFPRYGIHLTNCTDSKVSNNTIIPSTPSGIGIALSDMRGGTKDNIIAGNRIGITAKGKNVIAFQYGILLFRVPTPQVPANSCSISCVTVATKSIITSNSNTINGNVLAGKVTESGIALADCSHHNEVFNNDLSRLTARRAQIRLCASNDNDFAGNNTLGSIDSQSAGGQKAAVLIEGSNNNKFDFSGSIKLGVTKLDGWFKGSYPSGVGWLYLDSQSADNEITASLLVPKKIPKAPLWDIKSVDLPFPCNQVRDLGKDNTYTGQEACLTAQRRTK